MEKEKKIKAGFPLSLLPLFLLLPLVFIINNLVAVLLNRFVFIERDLCYFGLLNLTQASLLMGFSFYLAKKQWNWGLNALGLSLSEMKKGLKKGLKYGPIVFLVVVLGAAIMEKIKPFEGDMQPFAQLVLKADSFSEIFILVLLGTVIAPLAEEIYFRGLLFAAIREQLGAVGGIFISGIVFGLMHFDLYRLLPLAIGGMVLAFLYHKTNSLYTVITAHGVWNGIMLLSLFFLQSA